MDPAAGLRGAPRVVVVVPCYNEGARLDLAALRSFDRHGLGLRFCFVNDGSRDDTLQVLNGLCASEPGLGTVLDLERNRGKAEAVRRGLREALGFGATFVGYWDADLATPLEELPAFLRVFEERPQVEIVLGSRVRLLGRHIERRPLRHYLGRVFATGASLTLGLPVYDTQCGAKMFRVTPLLGDLLSEPFLSRWVFDVELLARFVRALRGMSGPPVSARVWELPLLRWVDVPGSKVRPFDFLWSGLELVRIWNTYRRRAAGS